MRNASPAPLADAKRRLFTLLRRQKIATVIITYDGEGDSGQIGDITAVDARRQPVPLYKPARLALHDPKTPTAYATLHDFAWTVLAALGSVQRALCKRPLTPRQSIFLS